SAGSARCVRFHAVTAWPARDRLRTMPRPIVPRPMKATSLILFPFEFVPQGCGTALASLRTGRPPTVRRSIAGQRRKDDHCKAAAGIDLAFGAFAEPARPAYSVAQRGDAVASVA